MLAAMSLNVASSVLPPGREDVYSEEGAGAYVLRIIVTVTGMYAFLLPAAFVLLGNCALESRRS